MKILALAGLCSGLFLTNVCSAAESKKNIQKNNAQTTISYKQREAENTGYHMMTEDELFLYLNSRTREMYKKLSPEGKKLALKVASARCNGTNECSGLNACKTAENECAGKGDCKGKGKCALADKNLAVKLVAEKMAKKREFLKNANHEQP